MPGGGFAGLEYSVFEEEHWIVLVSVISFVATHSASIFMIFASLERPAAHLRSLAWHFGRLGLSGLDGTPENVLVGDEAVSASAGLYSYRSGC